MKSYEFIADVDNGIINIPERFTDESLSRVRVILLADSVKRVPENRKNRFTAMRLKTKGFTFNREESHERQSFH